VLKEVYGGKSRRHPETKYQRDDEDITAKVTADFKWKYSIAFTK
jgi:hypothetical protein